MSRLYAACGRPAPAVVASASPGRVLAMAAALTRPAASLASLQLVLLGIAAALLAGLMTGTPAHDLAGGLMLLAAMPLVAGCSTSARSLAEGRRSRVLGLLPWTALLAAFAGVLWATDGDEAAALTAALWAGLAATVLSCLALLSWPVLARLRLAWVHPGLLPALGWQGVLRGVRPLAAALAPLLGEALAEEAAGEGRLQALAACRGVPSQPRHGRVRLALERRCAQLGLDWAAPGGALGQGCPVRPSLWGAAGGEAAAVWRCHEPVAPVAARPARLALAAAEACEAVLDAAWLLDGVAVVLPAAAAGPDKGGLGSGLAAGRAQGGQDAAEPETPEREPEDGQHAPIPDALLEGLGPRRRPWQVMLMWTGTTAPSLLLHEQMGRILDLFPGTGGLTLHTADGCLRAARDFHGNAGEEVDGILARLFQDNLAVKGVTFPATATRPAHTATPDDPFWSSQGKAGATIMAAWKDGRITPEQAIGQLKQLYAADAAASGTVLGQEGPPQLL